MAAAPAIAGTHHWISCLYTNPPSHSCMPYQARGVATTIAIKTSFIKSIDSRFTMVLTVFASVAILVSCLGLFGLATYTAQVKLKEIGIRKVLGASVANITAMLSKDFLMLVLISLVISSPIAWFAMNKWLEDYAYRTSIGWWVFVFAGASALLIAFVTISFQAIRAALANPVKSLRSE
jgi:putative ABC transport system permease protein